jgi:type I restriction enzyme M protein
MDNHLSNWVQRRYETLWLHFGERAFRSKEAAEVLGRRHEDSKAQVNVILSQLRKGGYLSVETDPRDARKKIYCLASPEAVIRQQLLLLTEVLNGEGGKPQEEPKLTRSELEALLKKAADLIRTRVDYTYILLLLFYKRICDKWQQDFERAYNQSLEDGFAKIEAVQEAHQLVYHDFDIPEEYLWENIRKDPARLPENLSQAMKALAERNPNLKDIFENVDFIQFTSSPENAEILRQLFELFSGHSLTHVSPDILGDAYEWILRYFAPQKAKEGEVYTSRQVIRLMVRVLDPQPGERVYDPACGSGGMLILSYKHVEKGLGRNEADKLFLYGQEANHRTLTLAKMNFYIHDIRNAQLALGDTLLYPKFFKDTRFHVVLTNPPWNQDGYPEEVLKKGEFWKERFPLGFTPKKSADWVWIQHLMASAEEEGRIAVVIDNGALFRGGKEKAIRQGALKKGLIECVILLPEKLFYNTGAPGAIIILRKGKPEDRRGKVLFINAGNEYEQHPEVRKLNRLGDEHIEKIARAYKDFSDVDGFSRVVDLSEIRDNDYNLNVTLYVFPEEETEEIDVAREWEELRRLEGEFMEVERRIENYLLELGRS